MRDTTVRELAQEVRDLKISIETLKTELGANTQATGFNTTGIEKITEAIRELANETGAWREDDKKHHKSESDIDKEKVDLLKEVKTLFEGHPDLKIKRTN